MKTFTIPVALLLVAISSHAETGNTGAGDSLKMPPSFSIDADPDEVLGEYPLGVIPRSAAFSHHGKAHKTVTLVNGMEGWTYEVHQGGNPKRYQQPEGPTSTTMDIHNHPAVMRYTLVFGADGTVIDVLFQDRQHETANSALLVQQEMHDRSGTDE